ncbi:MAG: BatA domain-containing protein [Holosporales bacterium]
MSVSFFALEWSAPGALWGLAGLPLLWWLSRQQPPVARHVRFPGAFLLIPPPPGTPPPRRSVLWRFLCRAGLITMILLAIANPHRPGGEYPLATSDTTTVLIDNTLWASPAQEFITRHIDNIQRQAAAAGKNLHFIGLAPLPDGRIAEANNAFRTQPWDIQTTAVPQAHILISSGFVSDAARLALKKNKDLAILAPEHAHLPPGGLWDFKPVATAQPAGIGLILPTPRPALPSVLETTPYLEAAMTILGGISNPDPDVLRQAGVGLFIWPGTVSLSASGKKALQEALEKGAVVLRLADAGMAEAGGSPWLPLALRPAVYEAGGVYSGLPPLGFGDFTKASPLAGITPPHDLQCLRALMAEVNADAAVWATFDNAAPLVSARKVGLGWLVLLHTAPTPTWCSLVLSDTWLEILERLRGLSQQHSQTPSPAGQYTLSERLEADGRLTPVSQSPVIAGKALLTEAPSPAVPFGRYRSGDGGLVWRADAALLPHTMLVRAVFGDAVLPPPEQPRNYRGMLLGLALGFLVLEGGLAGWFSRRLLVFIIFAALSPPFFEAHAEYRLCARADNPGRVAVVRSGMERLSLTLRQRTSLSPAESLVFSSNVPVDTLADCLLVYWPAEGFGAADAPWLGGIAALDGTVVLDGAVPAEELIRTAGLPLLRPMPGDFIALRTFYRLSGLYGTGTGEALISLYGTGKNPQDTAPVLVVNTGLAEAWAAGDEAALRAGINLVIYATTGTYKDDSVHRQALFDSWERRRP